MQRRIWILGATALTLAACSERSVMEPEVADVAFAQTESTTGAVYVLTNAAAGNEVVAFPRSADGTLGAPVAYSTGGTGTGAGLGSQGAVILSLSQKWLLAVNAGSNELSVFRVMPGGLQLTDRIESGGEMPISVTEHGGTIYVLNAGGSGNVTGFRNVAGDLQPIPNSTQPLSGAGTGPAQVQFSPNGRHIVVTEKATNLILTYRVNWPGVAAPPQVLASEGATPFGFAFTSSNLLLVSEAFGGAPDASALSSYSLLLNGGLTTISATVGTTETAACWTVVTANGRFAYVTNTGSNTVTGYEIGLDGRLFLLDADGETAMSGPAPTDADFSNGDGFLYVLNSGDGTISGYAVGGNGAGLTPAGGAGGLPAGAVGVAAH